MAIWNRNKQRLNESGIQSKQASIADLSSLPYYQYMTSIAAMRGQQLGINSSIKDSMLKDPIVTAIINMWISDTLSKDIITGRIFDITIESLDETVPESDVAKLHKYIDYLLSNSNLDDILVQILYQIITDGISNVRLGYVDTYEDTKIKLFESNKKLIESEANTFSKGNVKKLLEAPSYDDYENTEGQKYKRSKNLRLNGRYYFEILPSKLIPLKHKGITILYLDPTNSLKVLNPRNITTFVNTRGGVKKLSLKSNPEDIVSDVYEIQLGKSFIEHAATPWSMLNTTEDCTLLALMTRSAIYRLFSIEVGSMSATETDKLLLEFKNRLTSRETINVREQYYSSAQTQVPLGDSILIPTRNGIGNVGVQAIGGDLDIKTQVPLDYFREQFLASLGIAKTLVYGDSEGALINTSATRQDIRYLRTIQQFTSILSLGLESIFKDFLSMLNVNLSKISLSVDFLHLNSEEAIQRMEYEQTKQEALDRAITSLNNLGINFEDGKYQKTRNELITRFMDDDLLKLIQEDEADQPKTLDPVPDEAAGDHEPLPSGSLATSEEGLDIPTDLGSDTDLAIDTEPLPSPTTEPSADSDVNDNPPYTLG